MPGVFGISVSEAAKTTGQAAVAVFQNTSSLTSSSNFEVGLPPLTGNESDVDVSADSDIAATARQSRLRDLSGNLVQPALFSISGAPNQVYSVSVPNTTTTLAGPASGNSETVVVFTDFSHDAGFTPTIGGDGTASFAVGARVSIETGDPFSTFGTDEDGNPVDGSSDELGATPEDEDSDEISRTIDGETPDQALQSDDVTDIDLSLLNTDNLLTASGTSDDDLAQAVRSHNPFSFAYDPRFLNVLVSYN